MFGTRIKIDPDLYQQVKKCAEQAGYASLDEFVAHVLEKEVARVIGSERDRNPDEEIEKRLKGLGYIE